MKLSFADVCLAIIAICSIIVVVWGTNAV